MVLDRERRLLDAAIEVLGNRGMRQLTHRAVDAAAGLPVGSTSNRFRTRESLLVGVLQRILERETADVDPAGHRHPHSHRRGGRRRDRPTRRGADRHADVVPSQARRAIFVEAANHPGLRFEITHLQDEIGVWMVPLLDELGIVRSLGATSTTSWP